jgi:hypothetical protein
MDKRVEIDLGCGKFKKESCIGIDKYDYGQEIIHDLDKGIPFDDNSVDYIYTSHFLESASDLFFIFNEMWRVGKPNAIIEIVIPCYPSYRAFDPFVHKHIFTEETFKFLTIPPHWTYIPEGLKARYELVNQHRGKHNDLYVTLRCVK